ncbi:GALE [Mytilus edulis]|uniref:UDP-glucose 4-epimerase n=1 Tax=Mytilus edulis TaxID=6550 RepID=A0A8S3U913_MYTED|nr:GALE [Mytilus edulis]
MSSGCVLVTGGAGFVGSHSVIELINAGYSVVVVDNFINANHETMMRIEEVCGTTITNYSIDLTDKSALQDLFSKHKFTSVIHTAGLKVIGESCDVPLLYYRVNVCGTINLIEVMKEHNVKNLIFSSSAAVYGSPEYLPLDEKHRTGRGIKPYGKTKQCMEELFKDLSKAEQGWNIIILRYFNVAGAHQSGKIGDSTQGPPAYLIAYCAQVAAGKRSEVVIYGNDFDTHDGTGVRDYVHVVDLAFAHVLAQRKLEKECGLRIYNIGSGQCYSVLDMINAMSQSSGKQVKYRIADRRPEDIGSFYCKPDLALEELGWKATKGLKEMCEDLWRWQSRNTDSSPIR